MSGTRELLLCDALCFPCKQSLTQDDNRSLAVAIHSCPRTINNNNDKKKKKKKNEKKKKHLLSANPLYIPELGALYKKKKKKKARTVQQQ